MAISHERKPTMNSFDSTIVADCMTRDVVTIKQSMNLSDAIRLMERRKLSAVPVVDGNERLCGILTTSDLISLTYDLQSEVSVFPYVSQAVRKTLTDALAEDNESVKVASAMCDDAVAITADTLLSEAANRLLESNCHHLVVVDDHTSFRPIGILSTIDIIRAVARQAPITLGMEAMTRWEDDGGQNVGADYPWLSEDPIETL